MELANEGCKMSCKLRDGRMGGRVRYNVIVRNEEQGYYKKLRRSKVAKRRLQRVLHASRLDASEQSKSEAGIPLRRVSSGIKSVPAGLEGRLRPTRAVCQDIQDAELCGAKEEEAKDFFERQFRYVPKISGGSSSAGSICDHSLGQEGTAVELEDASAGQDSQIFPDVHGVSSAAFNLNAGPVTPSSGNCRAGKQSSRAPEHYAREDSSSESSDSESDDDGRIIVHAKESTFASPRNSAVAAPNLHVSEVKKSPIHPCGVNPPCPSQVIVCGGKGCSKRGAKEVLASLNGHSGISVTECNCLKLCGKGPAIAVKSGSEVVHYTGVSSSNARQFIEDSLGV